MNSSLLPNWVERVTLWRRSDSRLPTNHRPSPPSPRLLNDMPPRHSGKEKASVEEEDEILQAVILADSFNSRFGPLTMDLPRVYTSGRPDESG